MSHKLKFLIPCINNNQSLYAFVENSFLFWWPKWKLQLSPTKKKQTPKQLNHKEIYQSFFFWNLFVLYEKSYHYDWSLPCSLNGFAQSHINQFWMNNTITTCSLHTFSLSTFLLTLETDCNFLDIPISSFSSIYNIYHLSGMKLWQTLISPMFWLLIFQRQYWQIVQNSIFRKNFFFLKDSLLIKEQLEWCKIRID